MFGSSGGGSGGGQNPLGALFGQGRGRSSRNQPRASRPAGGGFNPLEMLFGSRGSGAGSPRNGGMDATFMQNFFGQGVPMDGGGASSSASAVQHTGAPPPTSKSTLRNLPHVKVTAHDIEKNESDECSICLDELVLGQPAIRIPCGHLYHEDCVQGWLKKSNECPDCRFELPTDDAKYEKGRKERMADRKIRLRPEDLAVRSCPELRRLAVFLKIDVRGCLEKSEFLECIAASDQVEMLKAQEGAGSSQSSGHLFGYACGDMGDADPPAQSQSNNFTETVTNDQTSGNSAGNAVTELKPAATEVSTAPPVMSDPASLQSVDEWLAAEPRSKPGPASQQATADATPSTPLEGQTVGQLRLLARQLTVSLDGCLEKCEIIHRIRQSPGYREA